MKEQLKKVEKDNAVAETISLGCFLQTKKAVIARPFRKLDCNDICFRKTIAEIIGNFSDFLICYMSIVFVKNLI